MMEEYIDKDELLSYLYNIQDEPHDIAIEIAQFPAADVVPVRHGRWVYGEDVDIECSHCGWDALTEGDYRQVRSNFCPHCGAKMDGEPDGRI